MMPRSRKRKRTAGRRNADFSTVPEGRRPDKKAFRRNAQPAPERGCSKGLGALPPTSRMNVPPGGGMFIFRMMGPSCPACPFLRPSLSIIPQLFRLLSSTKTISGRLLKRIGIMLFPRPQLTTMFVPPSVYRPASYFGKSP